MTVSLPMYAIHRADVERFWLKLRLLLSRRGLHDLPRRLSWPENLAEHWRQPEMLISQTCGYPLTSRLPDAAVIGAFHYDAPGCSGFYYRSLLITRAGDARQTLADYRGGVAACNSADSHSGYHILRYEVAKLAPENGFFRAVTFTGSHEQSLYALRAGKADIAAVDNVTYALLKRHKPTALDGVRIIGATTAAPGLPLITAPGVSAELMAALCGALEDIIDSPGGRSSCDALLITGFSRVTRADYDVITKMSDYAKRQGIAAL